MDEGLAQLLIIPGIGEDERMSYPQLVLPFTLIRPRYIEPQSGETLSNYCHRFADDLAPLIDFRRPLFLMGASLGAPVVEELSQHLPASGIILISGFRSSGELYPLYRIFGRYFAQHIPDSVYQFGAFFAKWVIGLLTRAPAHDLKTCAKMYSEFPKPWFRMLAIMGAYWEGCKANTRVLRIHGTRDPIIPYVGQRDIDVLIKNDKHMCNLSEKEIVNDEIRKFISGRLAIGR